MTLEFKVTGQHISWLNNTEHVVADSRNYLKAKFTFSEEWTYPVTVLFKGRCKTVPVLLAQEGEEITVPPEVLKGPLMLVSCYCGDLITTDSTRVKIDPSGYTESPEPSDPEAPSYYSQMIAYIDQINALIGEDAEAKDTLTKLQDVIDKAQDATTLPDQTVIGQMDALIDQYISNEDAVAYQLISKQCETIRYAGEIVGEYSFSYMPFLTKAYLPNCIEIKRDAFRDAKAISKVYMPEVKILGASAFGCESRNSLSKIYAPRLEEVYNSAFKYAPYLEKLDLPKLRLIGTLAFNFASAKALILRGDKLCVLEKTDGLSNSDIAKGKGYIYVPRTLLEAYKRETNWTVYADQIRAIEDYPDICAPEEWED